MHCDIWYPIQYIHRETPCELYRLLYSNPGIGICMLPTNGRTKGREINFPPPSKNPFDRHRYRIGFLIITGNTPPLMDAGIEYELQYSQKGWARTYLCARVCVDLLCVWSGGFRYNSFFTPSAK